MKISRLNRHPDTRDEDAGVRTAAPAHVDHAPRPWQPAILPRLEATPMERDDPFVSSGALSFAFEDDGDGFESGSRAQLAVDPEPHAPSPVPGNGVSAYEPPPPSDFATTEQWAARPEVNPDDAAAEAELPDGDWPSTTSIARLDAAPAAAGLRAFPQVPRESTPQLKPAELAQHPARVAPPFPMPPAPKAVPAAPAPDDRTWTVDTGVALVQPRSATEVLGTLADKVSAGTVDQYQPVPLGFTPLDKTIGGGLRAGELLLIGGAQGTGKTTMAVQMARNIVLGGQASVLYICFEHDEEYLLNRIIAMESVLAQLPAKTGGVKLQDVRREILGTWLAQGGESADLSANPRLKPALERIARYGPNLYLLRGSQTTSTVENMRSLITRYKQLSGDRRLVVFVDYMQKVPVIPEPNTETEKVTYIVNGLKDIALSLDVPMISIVAADKEGLKAARLRNYHLRGSSAINYEADVILILNEKYNIVAKVNIEFNPYQAQRFREWVIVSVEKNRGGQHSIDLEFQKHFEYSCFDANGRTVQEKLIEERLYND